MFLFGQTEDIRGAENSTGTTIRAKGIRAIVPWKDFSHAKTRRTNRVSDISHRGGCSAAGKTDAGKLPWEEGYNNGTEYQKVGNERGNSSWVVNERENTSAITCMYGIAPIPP